MTDRPVTELGFSDLCNVFSLCRLDPADNTISVDGHMLDHYK